MRFWVTLGLALVVGYQTCALTLHQAVHKTVEMHHGSGIAASDPHCDLCMIGAATKLFSVRVFNWVGPIPIAAVLSPLDLSTVASFLQNSDWARGPPVLQL